MVKVYIVQNIVVIYNRHLRNKLYSTRQRNKNKKKTKPREEKGGRKQTLKQIENEKIEQRIEKEKMRKK